MHKMGRVLFTTVLVCCLWPMATTSNVGICYCQEKVTKYITISTTVPVYYLGKHFRNKVVYTNKPIDGYISVPSCCPRYKVIGNDPLQCEPICEPRCVNAECIGPNLCSCRKGYVWKGNVCTPVCSKRCINGKCIEPNLCQCNSGFTKTAWNMCIPICQLSCENGVCIDGKCVCINGYKQIAPNKCSKECKCENGRCTPAGICECNEGYFGNSSFRCFPYCSKGCKNGHCIAPDTCDCTTGFEHNKNDECVPRCSPVCINGICQPHNKCVCNPGFTMSRTGVCEPECAQMCINGKCIAPNTCTCDDGYEKDPTDETNSRCIPRYEDRCRYGQNACTCDEGYVIDSTSRECVPRCSNNCTHGTCAENGTCSCEEGWTGVSCDTLDLCWKCNRKNTIRCTPNTEGCDCTVGSSTDPCTDRCRLHDDKFQASCLHLANCSCLRKECLESDGICYCSSDAVKCESLSTAAASLEEDNSTNLGVIGILLLTLMILVSIVVPAVKYIRSQYDLRKMKRNTDDDNYYDDVSNPVIWSTTVENELYDVTLSDSETDAYEQL